ncbi:hypothetical protein L915_02710, partial [Phytophthora nicotianae]
PPLLKISHESLDLRRWICIPLMCSCTVCIATRSVPNLILALDQHAQLAKRSHTPLQNLRPSRIYLLAPRSTAMRLVQVVLVVIVVLLVSCGAVQTTNNKISTTTSSTSIVDSLRRFLFAPDTEATKEERSYNAAVSAGGEGGRTGAGVTGITPSTVTSGGTVTITKYWNNGLIQRFKRWLKKIFHRQSSSSTRFLRQ